MWIFSPLTLHSELKASLARLGNVAHIVVRSLSNALNPCVHTSYVMGGLVTGVAVTVPDSAHDICCVGLWICICVNALAGYTARAADSIMCVDAALLTA